MYIVHEKQFLFFHLRKAAGSSIGKMIRNQYPDAEALYKHYPYLWLPKKYQEYVKNYYVITWVRNPITRFVSWWAYLNQQVKPENNKKDNRLKMEKFLRRVPTFEAFVYSLQEDKSKDHLEHYYFQRTMKSSISNENGEILSNYIGKQENFVDDWNILAPRIGCQNQEIVHQNQNHDGKKELLEYFTSPELIDIVYNYYKVDFDTFGYEIPKELQ